MKKSNKVWFTKLGGGILRLANGRIIKPNQRFQIDPREIPAAFMDTLKAEDPEKAEEVLSNKVDVVPTVYEIKEDTPGWYDVVDANGKAINEKKLRQGQAESLKQALEK